MDQLPNTRRHRWSAFAAGLVLAALALGSTALIAPHAWAQAGGDGGAAGKTVQGAAGKALDQVSGRWEGGLKVLIVVALFVVPIVVGNWLAKRLRMPEHGWKFAIAIGTIAAAAVVVSTGQIKLGPDLSGGITLIYELADESSQPPAEAAPAGEGAAAEKQAAQGGAKEEPSDPDAAEKDPADKDAADKSSADETDEDAAEDSEEGRAPASAAGSGGGPTRDQMVAQLIEVLARRIDPTGTKEVSIRKYGDGQIEIIIPTAEQQELDYIQRRISTAGALVFRITASEKFPAHRPTINLARALKPGQDVVKTDDGKEVARWVALDEKEFPTIDEANRRGMVTRATPAGPQALVLTDDGLDVKGDMLRAVTPGVGPTGEPEVEFAFNADGAFLFGQLTGQHIPTSSGLSYNLGILLDNRLLSAPTINSKITDRGTISGSMSEDDVNFLVGILQAGQLPAALNKAPISKAQISPTLGAQTIEKGKLSLGISLFLVALFMVYYYRFAGVVAVVGLAVNMLLIVGCMVLIKAAFTLPGLAGLVLTVGMSVDANVLIYERMREELKRGAALRMAIRNGFDRATTTIIDSNVTNLITGIVIYKIAPDSVKGFGITLVLGIAMSIFVAVFLLRIVFDVAERRHWITTLRMREFIGETNFDFLGVRRWCIGGSLAVIAVGLLAVAARRGDLLDIDFTGGSSVQLVLRDDQKMDFDAVLEVLNGTTLADKNLSLVEMGQTKTRYTVTTVDDNVTEVEQVLADAFAGKLKTYEVSVTDLKAIPADAAGATGWLPPGGRARWWSDAPLPLSYVTMLQAPPADESPTNDAKADEAKGEAAKTEEAQAEDTPSSEEKEASGDTGGKDAKAPAEGAAKATETPAAAAAVTAAGEDTFAGGASATIKFGDVGGGDATDATSASGVSFGAMEQLLLDALKATGHEGAVYDISNPGHVGETARNFSEWNVKLALPLADAEKVFHAIESSLDGKPVFPLSNKIGGRVAARMATDALFAIVLCLAGIIGYVWFRFHGVIYGVAAVVALIHDVLVALGAVALSSFLVEYAPPVANALMIDKFQVSLTLVAAFLTIIGYSLNDTIVIFDRIREVKGKSPRLTAEMINLSVNQCFARTLLTSFTSLISVFVLYVIGGEGIHAFAFALLIGFIAGVYSTIYIANPVLLWLSQRAEAAAARPGSKAA
jgi:SecD/SecF fusion protein